jgi:alpha-tubulin suppressor-like RCC1 family protein
MKRAAAALLVLMVLGPMALGACNRKKPPVAAKLWTGKNGGCVEIFAGKDTTGPLSCWGEIGGAVSSSTKDAQFASNVVLAEHERVTGLALGDQHGCAVFDNANVRCWGDARFFKGGKEAKLITKPEEPAITYSKASAGSLTVYAGGTHTCLRWTGGFECAGSDEDDQLGRAPPGDPLAGISTWGGRNAPIRAVALGDRHTCVAYGPSNSSAPTKEQSMVRCHGKKDVVPTEPILSGASIKQLAAGGEHTCALLEDASIKCWGKNESGQLGDGTTTDSPLEPVIVPDVRAAEIMAGNRHTCALIVNGTVACWGANDHHQLANGGTERNARPSVIVGLVIVKQISASGDGGCARLDGGFIRCWGRNDRGQLGVGSLEEQTVPMQLKYR